MKKPSRELKLNEIGTVTLSLSHPIACEPYAESRDLGGFILIDRLTRNTVGAGLVQRHRVLAQCTCSGTAWRWTSSRARR